METQITVSDHPGGEDDLVFATYAGNVRLRVSAETLTPYGGLVPWAAFMKHNGIVEQLVQTCPVRRTSPNAAPVRDVLQSFFLTALTDGRRFAHVQRLREERGLCELFGMKTVVSDDTLRRFFKSMEPTQAAEWVAQASAQLLALLPERLILDWDSTVITKYGHQEGARKGYNPTKRGRASFHPLVAVAAGTRLCASYHFRPGDTVTSTQWASAAEEAQRNMGGREAWLHRGDIGLGQETVMAWHENAPPGQKRPFYLFKLKLTPNARRAMAAVREQDWQGPGTQGTWQVAEARVRLDGWSAERRVIFARKLQGLLPEKPQATFWKENKHELAAYVTNLDEKQLNAWQTLPLYAERADTENVFDELKNQWGFEGFSAKQKAVSALAARLLLLVYNLWGIFSRLMEPSKHVEAAGSRKWFMVIAGRLVKSGRQYEMQISAQGTWWEGLKRGYERVLAWLTATAPQLRLTGQKPPPAPLFLSQKPALNCGI